MTGAEPSGGVPAGDPGEGGAGGDLAPLDVDGVRTVAVGTVLWAVAALVLLVRRADLVAAGHEEWLWTCVAGAGLGLLGVAYCRRRRDRLRRRPRDQSSGPAEV